MQRTKATFKAIRETVGLSQDNVAQLCGVTVTSVKRWERPGYQMPPDDAWDIILQAYGEHLGAISETVDQVFDIAEAIGHNPDVVPLTYYRSQEQYDQLGRDPGFYGVVNARTRIVADELLAEGIDVEFRYPDEGAVQTPGSRY